MRTESRNRLALVLPLIAGMVGGLLIGMALYERVVQEIERTSQKPANVAILDLTDVLFGYSALGAFAGTLIGLLVGVFLYAWLNNRHPGSWTGLSRL